MIHGGLKKRRVLIVDDDPVLQTLLSAVLEKSGYEIGVAQDGSAAIQASPGFDLVLIDVNMPVMDGVEATRRIRADETGSRHVAIIAMTANASAAELDRCVAAGIDEFLIKPFDQDALLASIARRLTMGA